MARYWYWVIDPEYCDETIIKTFKNYQERRSDMIEIRPGGDLSGVVSGDIVYICAHGHELETYVTSHPNKNGHNTKIVKFDQLVDMICESRLSTPAPSMKIGIKLLVCWAGGKTLENNQYEMCFKKDTIEKPKYPSLSRFGYNKTKTVEIGFAKPQNALYEWAKQDAITTKEKHDGVLACELAKKLKEKGFNGILVGGFPGRLTAHLRKIKEIDIDVEKIPFSCAISKGTIWFDGDGNTHRSDFIHQ